MTFYSSKVSKKVYKFQKFWAYVYQYYDQIVFVPFFILQLLQLIQFQSVQVVFSACRRWIPSSVKDVCVWFCIVMFWIRWQLAHSSHGINNPYHFPWCNDAGASTSHHFRSCIWQVFGDMNYWYNMQPYYDIENINTYPSDTQQKNTIEEKHMKGILERRVATGRKVNGQCVQDMFVKSCLKWCKVVLFVLQLMC